MDGDALFPFVETHARLGRCPMDRCRKSGAQVDIARCTTMRRGADTPIDFEQVRNSAAGFDDELGEEESADAEGSRKLGGDGAQLHSAKIPCYRRRAGGFRTPYQLLQCPTGEQGALPRRRVEILNGTFDVRLKEVSLPRPDRHLTRVCHSECVEGLAERTAIRADPDALPGEVVRTLQHDWITITRQERVSVPDPADDGIRRNAYSQRFGKLRKRGFVNACLIMHGVAERRLNQFGNP